jgi:hypothetical protein
MITEVSITQSSSKKMATAKEEWLRRKILKDLAGWTDRGHQ